MMTTAATPSVTLTVIVTSFTPTLKARIFDEAATPENT